MPSRLCIADKPLRQPEDKQSSKGLSKSVKCRPQTCSTFATNELIGVFYKQAQQKQGCGSDEMLCRCWSLASNYIGKRPRWYPDVYGIDHANAEHVHTLAYALTRTTHFMDMSSGEVLSSFQASCHRFKSDPGLTWVWPGSVCHTFRFNHLAVACSGISTNLYAKENILDVDIPFDNSTIRKHGFSPAMSLGKFCFPTVWQAHCMPSQRWTALHILCWNWTALKF